MANTEVIPSTLTWTPPTVLSPDRIVGLEDVRRYIIELDLSGPCEQLFRPADDLGLGWSADRGAYAVALYRRWLYLQRKFEGERLPPHVDIDAVWHAHILDTRAYWRDCDRIFGYYFHHYPYFGTRDDADRLNLTASWQQTQSRYFSEYGDYIYDHVEGLARDDRGPGMPRQYQ